MRSGRPAARPRVETAASSVRPDPPVASSAGGGGRPSITSRAAVLALVLAALMVSYAYPLRTWYEQHTHRQDLEEEAAQLRESVDQLEAELRLWDDPAYVTAQARDRLGFVLPGEQGYVVVSDPDAPEAATEVGADGLPPAGEGTWYERLWSSAEAADATPPEDGP